ncbi:MAG: DUF4232 domain-containing protein [Jatrophihabitans sp.]
MTVRLTRSPLRPGAAVLSAAVLSAAVLSVAVLVAVLAGCGARSARSSAPASTAVTDSQPAVIISDTPTDTDSPTDTSSPTDSATTAPPSSVATSKTSSAPADLVVCAPPYLTVSAKQASGGDGHDGYVLRYTNTGQISCSMTGYPGLAILNAAGKQILQATRTPAGYLGGIRNGKPPFPTVTLSAGESASALLEGIPSDTRGNGCPTEHALLTTAPNTTSSVRVAITTTICSQVQIHPIVAGSTGTRM